MVETTEKIVNIIKFTSSGRNNSLVEVVKAKSDSQFTFASLRKGKMLVASFYTPEGYSFSTAALKYGPVTLKGSPQMKKYSTKGELLTKIIEYMRGAEFKDQATDEQINESIKTLPDFEESNQIDFDNITK